MKDRIKGTFDQIQAEEALKEKTRAYVEYKTRRYTKRNFVNYHLFISVATCLVFLVIGGNWLYFTPTTKISIDVNPSIELGINRFDKVVSVRSYNDDGKKLTNTLNIKFMNYMEAVNQILESETIAVLLSNDEIMAITVIKSDGVQSARILSDLEFCTSEHQNTYCYFADSKEVEVAHELGLSCGKYRAFLELQELNPDITSEEIQGMTMREIHDLINALSPDNETEIQSEDDGGHHGARNRYRHRGKK